MTMPKRRQSSVKRYHDRVAPVYDDSYDDVYWRWHDALTWDHLKPFLPRDANAEVIDLGCGTGKWGLKLLKSGYRVTFLDISARMLEAARARVDEIQAAGRATFTCGNLEDANAAPAGRFALATAFGEPLGCTASPQIALNRVAEMLSTGGVLVATLDNRWACLDYYLERGDLRELARFLEEGRTHWLTRREEERFPIWTCRPGELARLLSSAGLALIDVIGKTVLPMRHYRRLLDDPEQARHLLELEKKLRKDAAAIGRAAHLQFAARRTS